MTGPAIAAIGLALVFGVGSARSAEPAVGSGKQGIVLESAPAVFETTERIMARHDRMLIEAPQKTLDLFIGRQDSSERKVDPDAVGRVQGPARGPQSPTIAGAGTPNLPQTVGVNANGPGSGAHPCATPPDTMGAIGPTQFISFVNCNIVSYDKSTGVPDGVLSTTPNNFFNSVRTPFISTSDSHIRYDRTSQRWFLFIIDVQFPNNRLLVAVSDTSTITLSTIWSFFFVQTAIGTHTNCLADYPTPGVDANAIYVGVNQFCGLTLNTATYAGSDLFVIQKSSVLGAGPIHATGFESVGPFTPQGVDNADPAATEGYVIATSNTSWSQLDLFRVNNPASLAPTLSAALNINTANQGDPITQPHLGNTGGTSGNIDGSDNRLFAATFRDGSLWTAMTVGTTVAAGNCVGTAGGTADRDAAFWWEITGIPTGSTPSVSQAGIVCDPSATNPNFYSYPTIAPNGQGHAALGFTIAGSLNFLSAGTAGRLAGDTPGALQAINVYGPGVAAYNPSWDPSLYGYRRWGDFSFTSLDPCDDQSLWTIQEYTPAANQYGTLFAQLEAPPPATPVSASPSSVAAGQSNASVVITGTSSAGSGFYDTPASLSGEPCRRRIASTVSGVTVNSVTWNSPTQVTLSLDTTSATIGTKDVTLTNPDGQAATGSGILTITSSCTPPATPTASNTGPYCAGATVSLSTPTVSGATYSWTGPNGFSSSSQNPTIPLATTTASGTYGVTVTVAGCTSAAGTTNVVVNAVPATPTASNTGPYCAGSTVSLSTPTVSGATYSWTGPNSLTSSSQNPTIPSAKTTASGTYSVTVTVAGCTSAAGATNVVVNAAPATPTASNTGPYCAGSTVSLSTPTVSGATYSWTGPNSFTSSSQNPTIPLATTTASGTYSVTVTVAGCTSAAGTTNVVVNAVPGTPTASNTGPYCAASTVSLSTPTVSGATYSWTGPNSFTSSSQNPTIPLATTTASGTYSVTVTVAGCTSAAGTTNVVVNAVPGTPMASNTGPYCAGSTVSLSTPTVSGATYSWTGPNSFTSSSQNPTIPLATTTASGTYSVTVTVAGCTSAAGTTNVVVNAVLSVPVVTAPSSVGAGSPNRTASVPAHTGSSYSWVIGNGTITAGQGTSQITFTAGAAGTLTLAVTELNAGCVSVPGSATVSVALPGSAVLFYSLPPCRVLDTRNPTGPLGAPSLQPGATRTFDVSTSPCGIPPGTVAISANLTVTNVGALGELVVFPSDILRPNVGTLSFRAGRTRANNAIVKLSSSSATFSIFNNCATTVDFIVDVNGFFQ